MADGREHDPDGRPAHLDDATSMRRFLDMSIDLLGIVDLSTNVLEISESWERVLGWRREDLVGMPLLPLFHEDDLPRVEAELASLLVGGDAVAVVVRIRAADGSYRWVQGNARADLGGGRIYVTAADITQRKSLEESLRRQLALEELVAAITARFVAADGPQVRAEIERALGDLAGAIGADRAHFLRGRRRQDDVTYIEWLHPQRGALDKEPDPRVVAWGVDVMRSGRTLELADIESLAADQPEVAAALVADGIRSILHVPLPVQRGCWGVLALTAFDGEIGFGDDATALVRLAGESFMTALSRVDEQAALADARQELEHRNEELERSNEELERFAYAAAHDLKAPLARIEMALAATPTPDGDAGQLLGVARRGAERMRQLIEDLLTFASVGTGTSRPEEVDLDRLFDEVKVDLEPSIVAGHAEVSGSGLGMGFGHRSLLGQLLQNLLGNSLKFARSDVAAVVRVSAEHDDAGVTIRVADNGIGIAPEHRSEVFGVFTRVSGDDQVPGSGIGLATCAKVVAHHGGRIWVEDGLDGGTAVVVTLPGPDASAGRADDR